MTTALGLYAVRKLIRKEITGMTGGLVMTSPDMVIIQAPHAGKLAPCKREACFVKGMAS